MLYKIIDKNDYKDSREQFLYALKLDNRLVETHYYLGKIYVSEGNTKAALQELRIYRKQMQQLDKLQDSDVLISTLKGRY